MADRYQRFASTGPGRLLVRRLGLPNPVPLRRHRPGDPLVPAPVLVGGGGRVTDAVHAALRSARVDTRSTPESDARYGALVLDATSIVDSRGLRALYDFFHPVVRGLTSCGRLIVIGTPPDQCDDSREATAQRAVEGFVRSMGKELRRGSTAQLVTVSVGAEHAVESTLRFLLSGRSAYVSGQVVRIDPVGAVPEVDWDRPLAGRTALVTGASRGIGAAIAEVLGRDGAHVVCLDVPAQGQDLSAVANRVGGSALQLDITADHAPGRLAEHLRDRHDGVDIVVHNAGITRDRTLAKMTEAQWDSVLAVNLTAQERLNDALLGADVLRRGGRVIGVSSIAGIAGNVGQANYATSKAGVIGMVRSLAPVLAARDVTINAVAPGFIETRMTAAIPLFLREAGRRMNSMSQGGLPVDVAETVAWFANPASTGVNGNVVRVCGQSLLGA
ncbi:3-oxoacyl-[acyl-carrier protein] reductase [Streptoalloteichus tenebrarius]|uniref:3-oxoacyl-[acyl-carrier protein] reductase n=1 Tax=Streptoalloteichus tenebrarius (strain ATCC 17920 / DSM 40477 / JCM 4838 / CBS 697.72 / NBRC 16177 / NCIMB 11028 / NRRL B-12390 / A12253. 1 / ISP 5477) TaxID=1933 RepID=A0ABT1I1Y8_STRSD|nr:3-oxoacyl-ACP reductase [Streptoalloteichus tenebrarius]MCP2261801.1 3-oxoacyl-[acyl-carrier protein] reductase [Streptoalloteichus tenebrarius]BFF02178.1 3-oxoacyl-ACP reductase [Streptoalloteichus tenebrarius]